MRHPYCRFSPIEQNSYNGTKNILIVDDKKTFCQLFVDILKASHPHFNLTVVMSAFWISELKQRLPAFVTFRFLSKPFDFSEGLNAMNESLKRNSKAGFVKGIHRTILIKKRPIQ